MPLQRVIYASENQRGEPFKTVMEVARWLDFLIGSPLPGSEIYLVESIQHFQIVDHYDLHVVVLVTTQLQPEKEEER
jgi:hypothetical protein